MTGDPKIAKSMNFKDFTSKNDGQLMTNPVLNDLSNVTVTTEGNATTVKVLPYIETTEFISNSLKKETKHSEAANEEISVLKHEREKKAKLIFSLEGLKESGGVIYIACKGNGPKTDPKKITEWFPTEFLNLHKIYAIKEEEAYLLKVFTRNHEATNRGIRKKGGRKVMLMGQEVFGDIMLACGYCGYCSQDGSNVRRHLKKAVCLKEKGYSEEDLIGLDKSERRKFLRRVAAAKSRAKKRTVGLNTEGTEETSKENNINQTTSIHQTVIDSTCMQSEGAHNNYTQDPVSINLSTDAYNNCECLVEIQDTCQDRNTSVEANVTSKIKTSNTGIPQTCGPKIKRRLPKTKPLMLGPAVEPEVVQRVPFDIYTVNDKMERVAWKPPTCPKVHNGESPCQIVFKGVRMKRRCMDLPVPMILTYRKLDCKSHHCIFTLFHTSARESFKNDTIAKSSVNIKMYGDTVMTQEFYHYFSSLMSLMKMKASQTARHFTSIWESIIAERLSSSSIPAEYRKIITLSKQTVKKVWSSIQVEAGNNGCILRLRKNPPCKKKKPHSQPTASTSATQNNTTTISSNLTPNQPTPTDEPVPFSLQVTQPLHQSCMKRINYINNKPPLSVGKSSGMMVASGPSLKMIQTSGPLNNHQPSPPHTGASISIASVSASPNTSAPSVSHSHWLHPPQQYPHNMHHYPMGPASAEYYHMPGHFMAQYAPVTIGSSP